MNRDRTPEPADDATSDLLTRLRPQARMDEAWSVEIHRAAHRQVLERIERERPTSAAVLVPAGRAGARRTARPWLTLTAAAGAAAAVAVIALGVPDATDRPDAPRPVATVERPAAGASPGVSTTAAPAATFLRDVALVAAEQPPDEHRDAPFWYTRARVDQAPLGPPDSSGWDNSAQQHLVTESWEGRTSPGRIAGPDRPPEGERMQGPSTWNIGQTTLTWDQLDQLPTDPVALGRRLDSELAYWRDQPMADPAQHRWDNIGDLLRDSPASPELRRALYEALATVPDTTVQEGVTDAVGRPGTSVTHTFSGGSGTPVATYEMIIEPTTGRLLQERNESLKKRGGSYYQATYLAQGGVDDDHATLPGS